MFTYFDRMIAAYHSPLGTLLVVLVVVLLLLIAIYVARLLLLRRRDGYKYHHQSYFNSAESRLKEWRLLPAAYSFFGRVNVVQNRQTESLWAVCTIAAPELTDEESRERFTLFLKAIKKKELSGFAHSTTPGQSESLTLIEEGYVTASGKPLQPLHHLLSDKRLSMHDREQIAVTLAHSLNGLHSIDSGEGFKLYHGQLLPSFIYLDVDKTFCLNSCIITQAPLAFAMSSDKLRQRVLSLNRGRLLLDPWQSRWLLAQTVMIAPELCHNKNSEAIGPAADFYAFGAIVCALLTCKSRLNIKEIDWSAIPSKWKLFLMACLADNPADRPCDFRQFNEWSSVVDKALAYRDPYHAVASDSLWQKQSDNNVADLIATMQLSTSNEKTSSLAMTPLQLADKALKSSRWKIAQQHYEEALKADPTNAPALTGMAISCYELGLSTQSYEYYLKAKEADLFTAKRYREHLAFKM